MLLILFYNPITLNGCCFIKIGGTVSIRVRWPYNLAQMMNLFHHSTEMAPQQLVFIYIP